MNPFPGALHYLSLFRGQVGRRLYVVFLLTGLAGLTEGLGITLLLPLLRVLEVRGEPTGRIAGIVSSLVTRLGVGGSLAGVLLLIGGLFLLKGAIQFANAAYVARLQSRLALELRTRLFDGYARMDYLYYTRGSTGHFVNVINSQTTTFFAAFGAFVNFATKLIMTTMYLGAATVISWRFGLLAAVLGAVLLLLFRALNQRVRNLSRQTSLEVSRLNKLLVQSLQAFKYLVSTNNMEQVRVAVVDSIREFADQTLRKQTASAFTAAVVEPVAVGFILAILVLQVSVYQQPIAPLIVSVVLFYRGMTSILGIQVQWQMVLGGVGAVEVIRDELEALRVHREPRGTLALGRLSQGIELKNVGFTYGRDTAEVLGGVSLVIPARSTVAFVGQSGAGKTTLVDLLTLLLKPEVGEILIDGIDSREVDVASWRSQVGYVSQETVVFDDTIGANISLALDGGRATETGALGERIRHAARRANIASFIEALPDGYETVVGERGVRLSGGQRQRLFIARELFKEPNLLILDEATSALDTEAERAVQESIDALRGRMTVVLIAHRLSTVRQADRVYVLDHGRVLESGSYDELRHRDHSKFRAMADLQTL